MSTAIFAAIVFLLVTVVFIISRLLKDNSVMDVAYGPIFSISAITAILLTGMYGTAALVVAGCLLVWSLRLGTRILRKNWGRPEDPRYQAWRERWLQKGRLYFLVRSYLQVNLLQGVIIVVVALPFIIALAAVYEYSLPFLYAGGAVFVFGLLYESIADWQLDRFLKQKKAGTTSAQILTTGLFRYSRRPNYFGETLVWWGLAIMALPLPFGPVALLSPLLITFIVTKVTGPMLEAQFLARHEQEYRTYMNTTSYFIPLPPKQL